jgi:SAM-dependent methyltransferase
MRSEQFQLHADIEQRHWWFVGRRRIVRRLIGRVLPPAQETTIVDVGCGTGANIAALANSYDCVGIDTSTEAIDLARQRFPEVRFLSGSAPADLGELALQARMFTLMDVLEHVDDDFALLSELMAASSPGTYFLLTVPADESLWSEHDESFGHYRRYDRDRFEQVWAGLPVRTLLTSYFNSRLCHLIRLIRARNRRKGRAAGSAGTDFWVPVAPVNRLLEATFAGEARRLLGVLGGRRRAYRAGASLVALLRREPGRIAVRTKPNDLPPDQHAPQLLAASV